MPPRSQKKRSAPSSEPGPSTQSSTKRTRFVEPSEDPANFAEEVDAALETPSAVRKGRVKTEGYESDSSDDGEGIVPSRRPGGDGAMEEEEEDMFAMADKEERKAAQEPAKAKPEFLREESEEEGEPEDEDEAERRKKAGMGFELSSFHMREEMEEGKFAADGTYVRTFDPHALHDRWMDGLDEKEIKQARRRKRHQDRLQKERMKAEEKELEELGGKEAIEREVLAMLKKGETVLEALQRLGVQAKKNRPKRQAIFFIISCVRILIQVYSNVVHKKKAPVDDDSMDVDKTKSHNSQAQLDIDQLTHLASTLMSLGDTDVYSKTYEEILRSVRSAGKVGPAWVPPSADVKYEYKWDIPGSTAENGQTFGPFSEDEMQTWFKASYFGIAGEKIKVRKFNGEWADWDEVF